MPEFPVSEFFPFHPLRLRLGLLAGALACAAFTASAFANACVSHEPLAWIRGFVYLVLLLGFTWLFIRLRPRAGWGVTVGPLGLTISRPLSGESQLAWSQVSTVRREDGGNRFGVYTKSGSVVWLEARLFARKAAFDSMISAVSARIELPYLDA